MPRVREIEEAGGDPVLTGTVRQGTRAVRRTAELDKGDGALSADLRAAKALGAAIERSGQLPAGLLPLVYLRVAIAERVPVLN